MKRVVAISAAAILIVAAIFGLSACQKKVEVETGTKVVCSYGHTVTDDIKTIEVPADEVSEHRVRTETVVCDRHKKLEALYQDAQQALRDGDTKAAKAKLTEVVALEKTFGKAQAQLDAVAKGETPKPDTGSTSGSAPDPKPANPGEGDTSGPSGSMKVWMPDKLTGFTANKPVVDVLTISRTYAPESGSKAFTLVIVAEQYRTAKDANAALNSRIKSRYTKDVDTLKINGHTIHFGTDGKQFAASGFTDGAILVAMEMSANQGVAPKELKGLVEGVLKQLP